MAGDALKDKNYAARERIYNDPERREEKLGKVGSDYDLKGYSDKEVIMAFKGGTFDDNDYARLTGKSIDDKPKNDPVTDNPPEGGSPEKDPPVTTNPVDDKPKKPPINIYPGPGGSSGSQTQIVNQDNDQTSTVTGNNNNVTQNQDNSVNQYGSMASGLKDKYVLNLMNRRGI